MEANTFWYPTVRLFDYLLRFLKLRPLDCIFTPHAAVKSDLKLVFDKPSGYLSVICRATDDVIPAEDDQWMRACASASWEYLWLVDWQRASDQPVSTIGCEREEGIDLALDLKSVGPAERPEDGHLLRLTDDS